MVIKCKTGRKPRFRVRQTAKGKQRLAFCNSKVVEIKNLKTGRVKRLRRKPRK